MVKRITDLPAASTLVGDELLEVSQLSTSVTITENSISAAASDNSFNDSGTGFVSAGFAVGDRIKVSGFANGANNLLVGIVTDLTAGKMTIGGTDGDVIVDEGSGGNVTIAKWGSRRATLADIGIGGGGASAPTVRTIAASDDLVVGDANNIVVTDTGSANTVTVPDEASVAFPDGTVVSVVQNGAGTTTIAADTGVTINGVLNGSADLASQYAAASLVKIATDEWNLVGTGAVA
jgi:hypothetical protein